MVSNKDIVYANAGTIVSAIGLVDPKDISKGLEVKTQFDAATIIPPTSVFGEKPKVGLVGMNMTYDDYIVIGSLNGVAVIDTALKKGQFLSFGDDNQMATNSLAVDKNGGIYVATGSKQPRLPGVMHKLVWTGSKISNDPVDGAWRAPYEGGDWPPAIKAGTGTGSTPRCKEDCVGRKDKPFLFRLDAWGCRLRKHGATGQFRSRCGFRERIQSE